MTEEDLKSLQKKGKQICCCCSYYIPLHQRSSLTVPLFSTFLVMKQTRSCTTPFQASRSRSVSSRSWLPKGRAGSNESFKEHESVIRVSYIRGNGWALRRWTGWVRTWVFWRPWWTSNRTLLQHWLSIMQIIWWKASLWLISHTSAKNQHLRNLTRANQTGAEDS